MKAGKYAVSIQYGSGYHYFVWTGDDREVWARTFNQQEAKMKKIADVQKKGAKPYALAWERNENPAYGGVIK